MTVGTISIDACEAHGTWFDKHELEQVMTHYRNASVERALKKAVDDGEAIRGAGEYARGAALWGGVAVAVLGAALRDVK
jgi:hypothetical protein